MDSWNLKYFDSGEYQVIEERLDDLKKLGIAVCPAAKDRFKALRETSYDSCKVAIFGQDPYPNPEHATGIAFDIPGDVPKNKFPPTLVNLFKEYQSDLHYPEPTKGSLLPWCKQGVLLYNVIPTCTAYRSMSHSNWYEYHYLTEELISLLNSKEEGEVVFVFLGSIAKNFQGKVSSRHPSLYYSHPSPRANNMSKTPFLGSRMFTTINSHLKEPVDWRL